MRINITHKALIYCVTICIAVTQIIPPSFSMLPHPDDPATPYRIPEIPIEDVALETSSDEDVPSGNAVRVENPLSPATKDAAQNTTNVDSPLTFQTTTQKQPASFNKTTRHISLEDNSIVLQGTIEGFVKGQHELNLSPLDETIRSSVQIDTQGNFSVLLEFGKTISFELDIDLIDYHNLKKLATLTYSTIDVQYNICGYGDTSCGEATCPTGTSPLLDFCREGNQIILPDWKGSGTWEINVPKPYITQNAPPQAKAGAFTIRENTFKDFQMDQCCTDPDHEFSELTIVLDAPEHGRIEYRSDSGTNAYTYFPDKDFYGEDTIYYTVTDPQGATTKSVINITVIREDDTPIAKDLELAVNEREEISITLESTKPTKEILYYTITKHPQYAFISEANIFGVVPTNVGENFAEINYRAELDPAERNLVKDVIEYKVCNSKNQCDTGTITLTITPKNDPPKTKSTTKTIDEDTLFKFTMENAFSDPDNDKKDLVLEIWDRTAHGTVFQTEEQVGSLSYTYKPNEDYNGEDIIGYTVKDPDGLIAFGKIEMTIEAVNDPPVAKDDFATTIEDTPITIDVLENDSDPDKDDIPTLDKITVEPTFGSVEINSDQTITYTPFLNQQAVHEDFTGSDYFEYQIYDSLAGSTATARVHITIENLNDPPVLEPITEFELKAGQGMGIESIFGYDPDGDEFKIEIRNAPKNAIFVDNEFFWTTKPGDHRLNDKGEPNNGIYEVEFIAKEIDTEELLESEPMILKIKVNPPDVQVLGSTTSDQANKHAVYGFFNQFFVIKEHYDPESKQWHFLSEGKKTPSPGSTTEAIVNAAMTYDNLETNAAGGLLPKIISTGDQASTTDVIVLLGTYPNEKGTRTFPLNEYQKMLPAIYGGKTNISVLDRPSEFEFVSTVRALADASQGKRNLLIMVSTHGYNGMFELNSDQYLYAQNFVNILSEEKVAQAYDGIASIITACLCGDEFCSAASTCYAPPTPIAKPDQFTVIQGESTTLDVLANDPPLSSGKEISIHDFTPPLWGTLEQVGDKFVYTPNELYFQSDVFSYSITDGSNVSSEVTVQIKIEHANNQDNLNNDKTGFILAAISPLAMTELAKLLLIRSIIRLLLKPKNPLTEDLEVLGRFIIPEEPANKVPELFARVMNIVLEHWEGFESDILEKVLSNQEQFIGLMIEREQLTDELLDATFTRIMPILLEGGDNVSPDVKTSAIAIFKKLTEAAPDRIPKDLPLAIRDFEGLINSLFSIQGEEKYLEDVDTNKDGFVSLQEVWDSVQAAYLLGFDDQNHLAHQFIESTQTKIQNSRAILNDVPERRYDLLATLESLFEYSREDETFDFKFHFITHSIHLDSLMRASRILDEETKKRIIRMSLEFMKDPLFFDPLVQRIIPLSFNERTVTGKYMTALTNRLTALLEQLPDSNALKSWLLHEWASIFETIPNLHDKVTAILPALDQFPFSQIEFDHFRSIGLYATSSADKNKVSEALLTDMNQINIFNQFGILVLDGERKFSAHEFSTIYNLLARYPTAILQPGLISGGTEYIESPDTETGRSGAWTTLNSRPDTFYTLLGKSDSLNDQLLQWILDHELWHGFGYLLNWTNLLPHKRWIIDTLFDEGDPDDRPFWGFQGCDSTQPSCPDETLPYSNSDANEYAAELGASVMHQTLGFLDLWIEQARNEGRFIGLRTHLSMLEILVHNSGGNELPNFKNGQLAGHLPVTTDNQHNITMIEVKAQDTRYHFTYTEDNLHITSIEIETISTGAREIIHNGADNFILLAISPLALTQAQKLTLIRSILKIKNTPDLISLEDLDIIRQFPIPKDSSNLPLLFADLMYDLFIHQQTSVVSNIEVEEMTLENFSKFIQLTDEQNILTTEKFTVFANTILSKIFSFDFGKSIREKSILRYLFNELKRINKDILKTLMPSSIQAYSDLFLSLIPYNLDENQLIHLIRLTEDIELSTFENIFALKDLNLSDENEVDLDENILRMLKLTDSFWKVSQGFTEQKLKALITTSEHFIARAKERHLDSNSQYASIILALETHINSGREKIIPAEIPNLHIQTGESRPPVKKNLPIDNLLIPIKDLEFQISYTPQTFESFLHAEVIFDSRNALWEFYGTLGARVTGNYSITLSYFDGYEHREIIIDIEVPPIRRAPYLSPIAEQQISRDIPHIEIPIELIDQDLLDNHFELTAEVPSSPDGSTPFDLTITPGEEDNQFVIEITYAENTVEGKYKVSITGKNFGQSKTSEFNVLVLNNELGDNNRDGQWTNEDANLLSSWIENEEYHVIGDINQDGTLDSYDVLRLNEILAKGNSAADLKLPIRYFEIRADAIELTTNWQLDELPDPSKISMNELDKDGNIIHEWNSSDIKNARFKGGSRRDPYDLSSPFNITFDNKGDKKNPFPATITVSGEEIQTDFSKVRFVSTRGSFGSNTNQTYSGILRETMAYEFLESLGIPSIQVIGYAEVTIIPTSSEENSLTHASHKDLYFILQRNDRDNSMTGNPDDISFNDVYDIKLVAEATDRGKSVLDPIYQTPEYTVFVEGDHLTQLTLTPVEQATNRFIVEGSVTLNFDLKQIARVNILQTILGNYDSGIFHNVDYVCPAPCTDPNTALWQHSPFDLDLSDGHPGLMNPFELNSHIQNLSPELQKVYYEAARDFFESIEDFNAIQRAVEKFPLSTNSSDYKNNLIARFSYLALTFSTNQSIANSIDAPYRPLNNTQMYIETLKQLLTVEPYMEELTGIIIQHLKTYQSRAEKVPDEASIYIEETQNNILDMLSVIQESNEKFQEALTNENVPEEIKQLIHSLPEYEHSDEPFEKYTLEMSRQVDQIISSSTEIQTLIENIELLKTSTNLISSEQLLNLFDILAKFQTTPNWINAVSLYNNPQLIELYYATTTILQQLDEWQALNNFLAAPKIEILYDEVQTTVTALIIPFTITKDHTSLSLAEIHRFIIIAGGSLTQEPLPEENINLIEENNRFILTIQRPLLGEPGAEEPLGVIISALIENSILEAFYLE